MTLQIKKTEWDLSPLLKNDDDPQIEKNLKEIETAHEKFVSKWKIRSDYLKNPKILKEALNELEKIQKNYGLSGNPGLYFNLRLSIEQSNPKIKAKINKVEDFEKKLSNNLKFFTLGISKIPEKEQGKFLSSSELKEYKHFLEKIFANAKHVLTENEEKILTLKESVAHDAWERMRTGIMTKQEKTISVKGKSETKNFSEILNLTSNVDRQTRENAAKAFNEILVETSDVAEAEMNAILANKKINDELRKFSRPDSARHLEDDISEKTVDTLISTVSENYKIAHRFYSLKAKLMKSKKIKYYERAIPYGESEKKYSYEEAVNLVHKTFSKLDKEFADIYEMYIKNSQIDVFPKKGKRSGAFCMDYLPVQPTYIMLNFDGSLKEITTIAHEVGHGINSELNKKSQNALNLGTPKSTAEVASTFMEDFVLDELLKEANNEERLTIMLEKLSGDMSTIFRQVAFYRFEFDLHKKFREKSYLSKEEIGELFKKHMAEYLGEFVDVSEATNWWTYVPHFRYIFYVYSYASGLLISKALQNNVKRDKKYIEKVKYFLSAGTSESPENIFKNIGVDITKKDFWENGLKEVENLLNETEKLAKKLGKI